MVATTASTAKKQAWEVNCDCGFMLRDHDQKEAISLVKSHGKTTHKMDMDDKAAMSLIKAVKG